MKVSDPGLMEGVTCAEASTLSRGFYVPCGAPATSVVWHRRDGRNTYAMCSPCTWHNVRNRGGRLLMTTDKSLIKEKDHASV